MHTRKIEGIKRENLKKQEMWHAWKSNERILEGTK